MSGEFLVFILLYSFVTAGFSAFIASQKHRDVVDWFFVGLLFGIFGIIGIAAVPALEAKKKPAKLVLTAEEKAARVVKHEAAVLAIKEKNKVFGPIIFGVLSALLAIILLKVLVFSIIIGIFVGVATFFFLNEERNQE